jgi:Zn finger protein HypA/HybF involved in hydrogenase expression
MSKEDDLKELARLREQLAALDMDCFAERLAGMTIRDKIKKIEDRWPIAWCSQCGSPINNCELFRGPVCPKCGHWT